MNPAVRAIKPDDRENNLQLSGTELSPPSAHHPVLVRAAVFPLTATVLRIDGPWVSLSIAGEMLRVLRTRLEKEFDV